MSEGNLQEWEEYDPRLLDDTQVRQSTLATPRLASQFPQASHETPGASEGPFQLGNAGETQAEMEGKSSILQSRFQFIDFPPCDPVHQGTGDIVYSPWLVDPPSVLGDVSKPLEFTAPTCAISVLCMTIDTPQGPNWYGIAYKRNIQSFNSVNIFCHPHPGHAGMKDSDYQSRGGEWPKLFRYAQNLGFQFSAANSNQILVVPFFSNASYASGGIFTSNWKSILTVIVNGVEAARSLAPGFRSSVNLETFEQRLREGKTLQHKVENIVLSSFSFGRTLLGTLRRGMAGLPGILNEVWDFDGSGGPVPSSSSTVKTLVYDQAVSNSPFGFHVPKQRWSKFAPAKNSDLHGFIPNMLMWHAATESGVGKASHASSAREAPELETQMQTESLIGADSKETVAGAADREGLPENSIELDPYAGIRSAMAPEHANLSANEITLVLGRIPATLVLHRLVHSPEMRQATLASFLGRAARRSVKLNGSDISIPNYFRMVSRLCREVAEQSEAEFKGVRPDRESAPTIERLAQDLPYVGPLGSYLNPLNQAARVVLPGLSSAQKKLLDSIFGASLATSIIRLNPNSFLGTGDCYRTTGNIINMPGKTIDDYHLIHEAAHVWQSQNTGLGVGYAVSALKNMAIAQVLGGDWQKAYDYSKVEKYYIPWRYWNAEQQAHWIQDNRRLPSGWMVGSALPDFGGSIESTGL